MASKTADVTVPGQTDVVVPGPGQTTNVSATGAPGYNGTTYTGEGSAGAGVRMAGLVVAVGAGVLML